MGFRWCTSVVANAKWPLLAGSAGANDTCSALLLLPKRKDATRIDIEYYSIVSRSLDLQTILGSHSVVFIHQFSTMAKKKSSSAVRFCRHVIATPCGDETTILLDQPAENNVHAREEVVGVNNPSTTLSTSVDNEAAADTRRESNMESNESTISYAET